MQGGTHEETPRPTSLVMDRAVLSLTEGRVGLGVFKGKFIETKIFELVNSEAQFPRDVVRADGEGVVVLDDKGHGEVVK